MKHYQRKGIPLGSPNPILPRLVQQTIRTGDCWTFLGRPAEVHTPKIGYLGHKQFVPRVAWMLFRGPIPKGKHVLHNCIANPRCWNPNHLYLGTHQDNMRDRQQQGRTAQHRGEENGRAKLTAAQVLEIRHEPLGLSSIELALNYGVGTTAIENIRNGKSWKHL